MVYTASASDTISGNNDIKLQITSSLNGSETKYLQNETERGWEKMGEFQNKLSILFAASRPNIPNSLCT